MLSKGLDVNVGGLRLESAGDERIHQANNGRFAGQILEILNVVDVERLVNLVIAGNLRERPGTVAVLALNRRFDF